MATAVLPAKENERAVLGTHSGKGLGARTQPQAGPSEPAQKKGLQDALKPRRALGDITNNKGASDSLKSLKSSKPAAKPSKQVEAFVDSAQKPEDDDFEIPDMPHRHQRQPKPPPTFSGLLGPPEIVQAIMEGRPVPYFEAFAESPRAKPVDIDRAELEPMPVLFTDDPAEERCAGPERADDAMDLEELGRTLFKPVPIDDSIFADAAREPDPGSA